MKETKAKSTKIHRNSRQLSTDYAGYFLIQATIDSPTQSQHVYLSIDILNNNIQSVQAQLL